MALKYDNITETLKFLGVYVFSQQLKEEKTKTTKYKKEIASLEKVIILTFRFHAHH